MRDTELYKHVLGLQEPWEVTRVELSLDDGRVDVWAEHGRAEWSCPECGRELVLYDHSQERAWRHLDTCQFLTYLHARPPRVKCPEHGVRQVKLPWAESMARFTTLFERLAVDVLKECDVLGAGRLMRLSWDETWHLMQRAVARGLLAKPVEVPSHVGVDEKTAGKGHDYVTVVSDLDRGTVEHLADDRKETSLDSYFVKFKPEQLAAIEAVAMDMWDPFVASVRTHLQDPDDKIVFDLFHIMRQMGTAVDTVRKREHRALRASGDFDEYWAFHLREELRRNHTRRYADGRLPDPMRPLRRVK